MKVLADTSKFMVVRFEGVELTDLWDFALKNSRVFDLAYFDVEFRKRGVRKDGKLENY